MKALVFWSVRTGSLRRRIDWRVRAVLVALVASIVVLTAGCGFLDRPGRCEGPDTACKSNLMNIGTACEMYSTDNGGRYPLRLSQLTPNYLKTIPTCPNAGHNTYSVGFVSDSNPDRYFVYCAGWHHQAVGTAPNYPCYSSEQGLLDRKTDSTPECFQAVATCEQDISALGQALLRYRAKMHSLPATLDALVPRFVRVLPSNPPVYHRNGQRFVLSCGGPYHIDAGVRPYFPRYDSECGLIVKYTLKDTSTMPPVDPRPRGVHIALAMLGLVGLLWLMTVWPRVSLTYRR